MKKSVLVLVSMLAVFGFAPRVFAIHAEIPADTQAVTAKGQVRVTLDGEFRIRGEFQQNVLDFDKDRADYFAAYDERVRLGLTANVTQNTTGRLKLETVSSKNLDSDNKFYWGQSNVNTLNAAAAGIYPRGNSKRDPMHILEAWVEHTGTGLFGIQAGVKAGHMPLSLGNGIFFSHVKYGDDAIVFYIDPSRELHAGLLTVKFAEGNSQASPGHNADADAYAGFFSYNMGKDTGISGDVTLVNDQYAGITQARATGLPAVAAAAGGTQVWNFGIRFNTVLSGLGLKGDAEVQTGESKDVAATSLDKKTAVRSGDIKQKGYAGMLGVSYNLEPVKLGLEGAYGSGDNDSSDLKSNTFITAVGTDQRYTYVYEFRAPAATGALHTGLSNTEYVKLSGDSDIMKDITANLSAYWLRAVKKTVIKLPGGNTKGDSNSIGTEIDAKVSYAIDRNFSYFIEGGYLFAGRFYNTAKKDADDAYMVRHGILLGF